MPRSNSGDLVYQTVAPGSRSGIYYIPVSNLNPTMTFTDLRAVACEVASVEKCFVYPNNREGWVRVRGRDQFLKAYKRLNGFNYNGTVLSASRQNENEDVHVWDVRRSHHGAESSSPQLSDGSAGSGSDFPTPVSMPATISASVPASVPVAVPNPGFGGTTYSGIDQQSSASAMYSRGAFQPMTGRSSMSMASTAGGFNAAASWFTPNSEGSQRGAPGYGSRQPNYNYNYNYSAGAPYSPSPAYAPAASMSPASYAAPGPLKVMVKNLSRQASPYELDVFLVNAIGGRHKLREGIRFPSAAPHSSSSARQHAILLFNNYVDALAAVGRLHKCWYQGLELEAHFVNEGIQATATATPSTADNDHHTQAPSSAVPGRNLSHNLVVDGSSDYGRAMQAEKSRAEQAKADKARADKSKALRKQHKHSG